MKRSHRTSSSLSESASFREELFKDIFDAFDSAMNDYTRIALLINDKAYVTNARFLTEYSYSYQTHTHHFLDRLNKRLEASTSEQFSNPVFMSLTQDCFLKLRVLKNALRDIVDKTTKIVKPPMQVDPSIKPDFEKGLERSRALEAQFNLFEDMGETLINAYMRRESTSFPTHRK